MSQKGWKAVVIIYVVALTVGSLQPLRPSGLHESELHRLLHFLCFGVLVLLARSAFRGHRSLAWIIPASILLGVTLEFLHHGEFHEAIEWGDIRDDAIGATLSGLLCKFR